MAILFSERLGESVVIRVCVCVSSRTERMRCKIGRDKIVFVSAYTPGNMARAGGTDTSIKFWCSFIERTT